jgi:hypothetical protein
MNQSPIVDDRLIEKKIAGRIFHYICSRSMTHASGISVPTELAALFTEARSDATFRYLKVEIVGAKSLSCTYTAKSANPDDVGNDEA